MSAILIPPTNTTTYSTAKTIPAGEAVILLKTVKGTYLRTSDGKFYALRSISSPSINNSSFNSSGQNVNNSDNNISNNLDNSNNTIINS